MILLTGGAGYIGSHTNKELYRQGYETIVLDNLSTGHQEFAKWGHLETGDLKDADIIRKIFESYPIKAVVHFAASAYVSESVINPEKYYHNNVVNTLNLLSVMKEYNVNYLIFSSTCAIYGIPVSIPILESHHRNPINPYGRSKYMIEDILSDYSVAFGLKYVALRYFNAAGADADGQVGERHNPETHLIPVNP